MSLMEHENYVKYYWYNVTENFRKLYQFLEKMSNIKVFY